LGSKSRCARNNEGNEVSMIKWLSDIAPEAIAHLEQRHELIEYARQKQDLCPPEVLPPALVAVTLDAYVFGRQHADREAATKHACAMLRHVAAGHKDEWVDDAPELALELCAAFDGALTRGVR
jgi:hypothetical protein